MDRPRYKIELAVVDLHTGETSVRCVGSNDFPIYSEQFVEDVRNPSPFNTSLVDFDGLVPIMKKREFRKMILKKAAIRLAGELGDYVEDKEGWNGEDRRDTIKENEKR